MKLPRRWFERTRPRILFLAVVGLVAVVASVTHVAIAQQSLERQVWPVRTVRLPRVRRSRPAVPIPRTGDTIRVAQAAPLESPANGGTGSQPEELPQRPPSGTRQFTVPLAGAAPRGIALDEQDGLISLVVRDGSLQDVLTALAETQGFNIVTASALDASLTITLDRVQLEHALDAILSAVGYTWSLNRHGIIHVTSLVASVAPELQGRQIEVFQLDYANAEDVNTVVSAMLSPVGQSFPLSSDTADNRRSRELIVVEDLPRYLERVREQIALIDLPPRQVLIHVYVLQVDLNDENKHGVDFEHTFNMTSNLLRFETSGFANSTSSQAFFFNVSGGNLSGLLEMLQSTTDSKTLASPKILCLNGQTSRIQVGEQLGFRVTTTTETSTLESVEFLDVGVVLEVTPRISRDGHVILRISPEVSSGEVSATTGLPEEATTELETDVLLADNQGVVIGGLIQEADSDRQAKLPWLGDLHYLGKLFQRKETLKRRSEIIIALLPRVVPFNPQFQAHSDQESLRAQTPLLCGPLQRNFRPWEPRLHDAMEHPKRLPPLRGCLNCLRCGGFGCGACQSVEPQIQAKMPPPGGMSPSSQGVVDPTSTEAFRPLPDIEWRVR